MYDSVSANNTEKTLEKFVDEFIDEIKVSNIQDKKDIKISGYTIIGYIEIPKIDLKYPIIKYIDDKSLWKAINHYSGPDLNEYGNVVLAGHKARNGTMFSKINKLKKGDIVKITDSSGRTIEYKVTTSYNVAPNNTKILEGTDHIRELTLFSCTSDLKNRYVVKLIENN